MEVQVDADIGFSLRVDKGDADERVVAETGVASTDESQGQRTELRVDEAARRQSRRVRAPSARPRFAGRNGHESLLLLFETLFDALDCGRHSETQSSDDAPTH